MCMGASDTPEAALARKNLAATVAKHQNADGTVRLDEYNADPNAAPQTTALQRGNMSAADKAAAAASDPLKPPPAAPDLTSALLSSTDRAALIRQRMSQGRRSTFLTGPQGDMSQPAIKKPSLLGG